MRKTVAVVSLAAALSLAPAAAAQAHEPVQDVVAVQPTPAPTQNDDGGDNRGLNGLWGLLGLAGLLGLIPRRPKTPETQYGRAETPTASTGMRTDVRETSRTR